MILLTVICVVAFSNSKLFTINAFPVFFISFILHFRHVYIGDTSAVGNAILTCLSSQLNIQTTEQVMELVVRKMLVTLPFSFQHLHLFLPQRARQRVKLTTSPIPAVKSHVY